MAIFALKYHILLMTMGTYEFKDGDMLFVKKGKQCELSSLLVRKNLISWWIEFEPNRKNIHTMYTIKMSKMINDGKNFGYVIMPLKSQF
jgi:hypothetical protein